MLGRFSFLQDKKKLFVFLLLIVGLPLATWLSLQQQDVRQRASESGNNPSVPTVQFSYGQPTSPVIIGQNIPLTLYVDSGDTKITALDVTFSFDKTQADFVSFTPQLSLEQLFNTASSANSTGNFRYAVSSASTNGITGKTAIGNIVLTAKAPGVFSPALFNIQVIGEGYTGVALNTLVERPMITFATAPTATSVPPTSTPVPPTATPVPPTATPAPLQGDVNADRSIDILDYNIWRNEFTKLSNTLQADLDKNSKVDLLDFSIWRDAFIKSVQATPTPVASTFKRVFVTSIAYNGNLGGTDGADAKCQARASTANLTGTWKAWISGNSTTTSVASRFTQSTSAYKLLNGTTVANNWNDLVDGTILSPITVTENGTSTYPTVWTGTGPSGSNWAGDTTAPSYNCNNWTTTSGSGGFGMAGTYTNQQWTYSGYAVACTGTYSLYCFEQ